MTSKEAIEYTIKQWEYIRNVVNKDDFNKHIPIKSGIGTYITNLKTKYIRQKYGSSLLNGCFLCTYTCTMSKHEIINCELCPIPYNLIMKDIKCHIQEFWDIVHSVTFDEFTTNIDKFISMLKGRECVV